MSGDAEPGLLFDLVDATGGGLAKVRADGTIADASPGFHFLAGATGELAGMDLVALMPELPPLGDLPEVASDSDVFRQIDADGVGRELAAAALPEADTVWLVLSDRSGEAKLRRRAKRLGRRTEDLAAEIEALERAPMRSRVRPLGELAVSLDEALSKARKFRHEVTTLSVQITNAGGDVDLDGLVLGCVRGVDEVGRGEGWQYVLVLPHTDLSGGRAVGDRILGRLRGATGSVGVAQARDRESAADLVQRANAARDEAASKGGGVLLAMDVL